MEIDGLEQRLSSVRMGPGRRPSGSGCRNQTGNPTEEGTILGVSLPREVGSILRRIFAPTFADWRSSDVSRCFRLIDQEGHHSGVS